MNGIQRKKGAGRKTMNPEMENEIVKWVMNKINITQSMPRRKILIDIHRYTL